MPRLIVNDLLAFSHEAVRAALTRAKNNPAALNAASCKQQAGADLCKAAPLLAIDATAGNGNDTELLARHVGDSGKVIAFDIQPEALQNTHARLERQNLAQRVQLVHDTHAQLLSYLPAQAAPVVAMFNLGFLPGGAANCTTMPQSSVAALKALAPVVAIHGLISVHCYTGQSNGAEEEAAVREWMQNLPWQSWRVARYDFCNKKTNYEVLYLAERIV
ncbi:methyltransferase domain-containing protein [Desulfovibrio sp. OttesenSCG-928-F07]|nr:methyltransferase domain-containing protein [Desulfovibrio sp. OttesenSCG-928-F07]